MRIDVDETFNDEELENLRYYARRVNELIEEYMTGYCTNEQLISELIALGN